MLLKNCIFFLSTRDFFEGNSSKFLPFRRGLLGRLHGQLLKCVVLSLYCGFNLEKFWIIQQSHWSTCLQTLQFSANSATFARM